MKSKNRIYAIATSFIILAIIISIAIPLKNSKIESEQIQIAKENSGLPKLNNFQELYDIAIRNKEEKLNAENSGDELIDENLKAISENFYQTNIQENGIDEGDIVKTDGKYIYYVTNKKVVLVSIEKKPSKISQLDYAKEEFVPERLYISENKLIVIGNTDVSNKDDEIEASDISENRDNKVIAKIYNIEKKKSPKLEREVSIEGEYISSRMIGENIYIFSNKNIDFYNFKDSIEEMNEEDFKPKYLDTIVSKEEQCIEYADISYFPESEDMAYLNIIGFNINNNKKANVETYLGAGDNIYCSANNLYIAKTKYEYKDEKAYGYYNNYDVNTYIYKFKLENAKTKYENIGSVSGSILNKFSINERNGYVRLATANNKNLANENITNNLYVLDENLKTVAILEDLARGQKVYSVNFMGNRAYIVTFVQTDPLFVIDLSDITNPVPLGELKISGYSKFLYPYDETHIIGFGENTTINEYGGVITNGMKMALLDVTDPENPNEKFAVSLGEKGTYSEVLNNSEALLLLKEKNLIAFPIYTIKEEENKVNEEENKAKLSFQGAITYTLDLENGLLEKGKIAHKGKGEEAFEYDNEKSVERILYINNNLYTLSQSLIKSTNIETMEEQGKLELITSK